MLWDLYFSDGEKKIRLWIRVKELGFFFIGWKYKDCLVVGYIFFLFLFWNREDWNSKIGR